MKFQPKNDGYKIRIFDKTVEFYRYFRKVQEENNKWLQPDEEKTVEQIVEEKKKLQAIKEQAIRDIHAAKVKRLLSATKKYV